MLTYPRTSSRFLTSDMIAELKPIAGHVGGASRDYQAAAAYVQGLDLLPLGRVVADDKVGDHHAIIPTNSTHNLDKLSDDDRRIYDLVARRFLAVFHPEAVFENTKVETTVAGHIFRTRGKVLLVPGWRGVYGELAETQQRDRRRRGPRPAAAQARAATRRSRRATSARPRRRPSRRGATPTPRCWARWRPPGGSSTTTRCARR